MGELDAHNRWEDKDFLLNVMGYHHLHLSRAIERPGLAKRTKNVLFVQVTRDTIHAIGFFDHTVFERTDVTSQAMTDERARLWKIYESRGRTAGAIYAMGSIATSGHAQQHVMLAQRYSRIIANIDSKLDRLNTRAEVFQDLPTPALKALKLQWQFNFLDLGLLDQSTATFYVLQKGPT